MAPKRHKRDLISRAELARRKGCTRGAVTRACQGPLRPAVVGRLVDAAHPLVQIWRVEADVAPTSPAIRDAQNEGPGPSEFLNIRYRRQQAEIERIESRNERDRGRLVSRELVRKHIFGLQDELHRRLLGNAARTIAVQLMSAMRAGATLEQCTAAVASLIGNELRMSRDRILNVLHSSALDVQGTPPPVTAIPPAESTAERRAIDAFVGRLTPRLREECAPRVVTAVAKTVERSAGAEGRFEPQIFERVMAASEACTPEAARQAATIIIACIESTLSDVTTEITPHAPAAAE